MKSYPEASEVLDDLGDKVTEAFARAVARTRADYSEYRELRPAWVAQATERGLATWIHDRLWYHLTVLLDGLPSVRLVDREPTREIFVGERYRLRAKRHGEDGNVSTYPTETAIEFLFQVEQETLDGLEEIRLVVGYVWDRETREIGSPVLSLRNTKGPEWVHELTDPGTGYASAPAQLIVPPQPGPPAPSIDLPGSEKREDATGGEAR